MEPRINEGSNMSQPPLVSLQEAKVTFGGKALFEHVTLHLERGKRTCLVGRNGCGKSTLMKVIAGLIDADAEQIYIQPGIKIHYLPQDVFYPDEATVLEVTSSPGIPQH